MSVRLNNGSDVLTCAIGSALSIGTGDVSLSFWCRHHTDFTVATGQKIVSIADAAAPSSANRFSIGIYNGSATEVSGEYHSSDYVSTGYTYTASTWYNYVLTRASGTVRFRVLDDGTGTTPLYNATVSDSTNDNDLDTIIIGFLSGVIEGAPVMVTNLKVQTGVAWSDAEARTEALYYGIQKSGGTDRYCWRLKDIDADTDGLYEFGGSGPNLTNSGAVADASNPTNLSEAGGGSPEPTTLWTPTQEWRAGRTGAQQLAIPRFRGEFGQ